MRKYIAAVFVLFLFSPAHSLTRAVVRNQIRYLVGDTETSTTTNKQRWPDAILNERINIVQTDIAIQTRCLYSRVISTPTAGVSEYRLPEDLIMIDRVSFLSIVGSTVAYKKLPWTSLGGLDRDMPNWESLPNGFPRYYYERVNSVGLTPAPSDTYAVSRALKIDYYARPADLTSDSQEPFSDDYSLRGYHNLIVLGVTIMCKKDDGKAAEVSVLQQEYFGLLKQMKDEIRTRPDAQETLKVR